MVALQKSTDAMADAIELAHETGDFGKAAKMMETCWAVRDQLNKHYPNFMNRTRLNDKARPQYFSGGIYDQYLGFDKKIKGSAASLLLPRYWQGMLDWPWRARPGRLLYYRHRRSFQRGGQLRHPCAPRRTDDHR